LEQLVITKFILLCFEFAFTMLCFFYYERLKKYGLTIVLPIVLSGFLIDLYFNFYTFQKIYSNYNTFEIMTLVLGISFFRVIKYYKLEPLLVIIFLYLITDVTAGIYQSKRLYNIHIWNTYHIVASIGFYILFFRILQPKKKYAYLYWALGVFFFMIYFIEYITNELPKQKINIITVIAFNMQNILLSGIIISKITLNAFTKRLIYEPFFWLFAGIITEGLIGAVVSSVFQYLVANPDQLSDFEFLLSVMQIVRFILDSSFFLCIVLCVRNYRLLQPFSQKVH